MPRISLRSQVWDLGGQSSIRPYWRCYYPNTDAIIFVVDSTDTERLETARVELHTMLSVRASRVPRHSLSQRPAHFNGRS